MPAATTGCAPAAAARPERHWRSGRACSVAPLHSDRRRFLELLGVVERDDGIEDLGHVAFEHVLQLVRREVDAVIGDAALREIVGADLLGALAGADLAAAVLRDRVLLLAHLHLVEARAQHLHGFRPVLDLRLLVLLRHDDAGRDVREAHGGVGRVHALAARAARAERVDAEILFVDLDVDLLGLGEHGDGGRGRVDAAAGLGVRHALHPVHAALVLQAAVGAAALDRGDDFLDAARAALAARHDLELPALALGVTAVHAEEIGGEERGFVAARAGADFENDVLVVVWVFRHEQEAKLAEQRVALLGQSPSALPAASSRISASPPRTSSSASSMFFWTVLKTRYFCTSGSRSDSVFAAFLYSAGSDWTSVVPSRAMRSSYCASTVVSLSNIGLWTG